ncbi:pantetheine-phosphate adenylyltransferase [Stylonychia lemnae]|uniref:Pantetheine-phosphate adenylyltransferase n=1 Tax=Stylonychia lemnae TaxID=5949 RepID=A0A078AAR0_STYLE|nr:pantetheine-phosphate adenylyltransferase [Stylonychia lemnae]|eukprot:CDW78682.1 pantetheine-phosphate adenylyltransferase [Stylonychia lemnae]
MESLTEQNITEQRGQIETALYILKITKSKLQDDPMKRLKSVLFIILAKVTKNLMIEIYFDESIENCPLKQIDVLFPQVFQNQSQLILNKNIQLLVYNEHDDHIINLLEQRSKLEGFPELQIERIQQILEQVMKEKQQFEFLRENILEAILESNDNLEFFKYEAVCLGGTFDHMHLGHKLLLSKALMCTKKRILVGVTTDALLKKKAYAEYLESYEQRKQSVIDFCNKINPKVEIDAFELSDPVGKSETDEQIQACILTREVEKGGAMINEARASRGLPPLDLVFVDIILAEEEKDNQIKFGNKTSSTQIRQYLSQQKQVNSDDQ